MAKTSQKALGGAYGPPTQSDLVGTKSETHTHTRTQIQPQTGPGVCQLMVPEVLLKLGVNREGVGVSSDGSGIPA